MHLRPDLLGGSGVLSGCHHAHVRCLSWALAGCLLSTRVLGAHRPSSGQGPTSPSHGCDGSCSEPPSHGPASAPGCGQTLGAQGRPGVEQGGLSGEWSLFLRPEQPTPAPSLRALELRAAPGSPQPGPARDALRSQGLVSPRLYPGPCAGTRGAPALQAPEVGARGCLSSPAEGSEGFLPQGLSAPALPPPPARRLPGLLRTVVRVVHCSRAPGREKGRWGHRTFCLWPDRMLRQVCHPEVGVIPKPGEQGRSTCLSLTQGPWPAARQGPPSRLPQLPLCLVCKRPWAGREEGLAQPLGNVC